MRAELSLSSTSQEDSRHSKTVLTGNILFFYAFDVGDDINVELIRQRRLLVTHEVPSSPYFKNYHLPLAFDLEDCYKHDHGRIERTDCISSKLHHFGVVSFCYKIPFQDTFEDLKRKLITTEQHYNRVSEKDAATVFNAIVSVVSKPRFYNLKNSYFAVQVNPLHDTIMPEEFKERYGGKIVSLLRLETENLSDYQKDDILASTTGYYGQDLIIIDTEASFVYDDEYFEAMEFFESANIQQLELQYFDRLLDEELNFFYTQHSYHVPLKAYIPLLGSRMELPVMRLVKLKVDISVVTERLESSIKMAGDAYYEKLYSMLVDKLSLPAWKDAINKKLGIIHDLYAVYQDRLETVRDEILTLVIIILIAVEVVAVFMR